jgi:hypothetical protein
MVVENKQIAISKWQLAGRLARAELVTGFWLIANCQLLFAEEFYRGFTRTGADRKKQIAISKWQLAMRFGAPTS